MNDFVNDLNKSTLQSELRIWWVSLNTFKMRLLFIRVKQYEWMFPMAGVKIGRIDAGEIDRAMGVSVEKWNYG